MVQLQLRPKADKRLRAGHPWVFSNEIDTGKTPFAHLEAGTLVLIVNAEGKPLGTGLLSPNNLICVRLLSRKPMEQLSKRFFKQRIAQAKELREQLYPGGHYRLLYGDSDGLPSVIVDAYGPYYVLQVNSAAMLKHLDLLVEALQAVTQAEGILLKNDGKMLAMEGIEPRVEVLHGQVPDKVRLIENGVHFWAPVWEGQKTGWFYDHRDNRAALAPIAPGARVLDVCSYVGGWGVQAAAFGAQEVICLDASAQALAWVAENASLNQLDGVVKCRQGDAFEEMKQLLAEDERFDLVILDPPAFIAKRKDQAAGERAYARMFQLGLRLVKPGGWLVAGSCSMHLSADTFVNILQASARQVDRRLQMVHQGHQGGDHPVHPAVPETAYIKSAMMRVEQNW